ncbi:MAG: hypothetical protein JRJ19_12035, partial [Deltaproteobacteria bacterium]|nr:hypothetical protein [Deltaproteobacteria bacterium]
MLRAEYTRKFTCLIFMVILLSTTAGRAEPKEAEPPYDLSRMEGFSWVLLQLKQDYVDPSRVRPAAMISRALEYIELRLNEVEIKLAAGRADVQVAGKSKSFNVGNPATVWEMNYNLQPIIAFIGKNLESSSDPKDVEFAAIDGML